MANLHLVTGFSGQPHVSAADQGSLFEALIRGGEFVLEAGTRFSASIVTNNQIRVNDGEMMMQGRHVKLNPGAYVDLAIENGSQGYRRSDLIVIRYTRTPDSGIEECNLVVLKGTPAETNPADPEYTTGNLNAEGALQHDFPLYRVSLSGLVLEGVTALFKTEKSIFDSALRLVGGSMAGNIAMSGYKVTGLGAPSANGDAVSLKYAKENFASIGLSSAYIDAVTDTDLASRLNEVYQGMANGSVKVIQLSVNANGLALSGGVWFVTFYRTSGQHGYVEAKGYSAGGGLLYVNTVYDGVWTGWKNRTVDAAYVAAATIE